MPGNFILVLVPKVGQNLLPGVIQAESFRIPLHCVDNVAVRIQLIVPFRVRPALEKLKEELFQFLALVVVTSPRFNDANLFPRLYLILPFLFLVLLRLQYF